MARGDAKQATLKTVAELTGVSQSTVSLCLRGGEGVKPATRERILKAARDVGYVPNRAGVRLRTGRTNVIALVLATDAHHLDFTRQLILGIGAQLESTRFHLNVVPEFTRADPTRAVRYVLETKSADGVILTHTSARDPRVQLLMDAEFPFVSHGRTEFYAPHPFNDFDSEGFVRLAVERLAGKGRRNVLLAVADNETTNYANILSAFRRAAAEAMLGGEVAPQPDALATVENARAFGRTLAGRTDPPDALIANNELMAIAMIGGLRDEGRELGRDYDLICKQTTDILPTLFPTIDTLLEDLRWTGGELASLLMRRIDGAAPSRLQSLTEPKPSWSS